MARQSRLDTPGALHHIIAGGNERRKIFEDKKDRNEFLIRLGDILSGTETICYAWAIIPNHFHLFLRTGTFPIATIMRRLLTGSAMYFNRRHRRYGHLFQNRYKSILCQKDPYFQELVRYIHLKSQGWDLDKLAAYVAELLEIDISVVWSAGKYRHIVEARSLLCYWAVRDLGLSMTSLAKRLKLSVAAISQSVERGERLKEEKLYHFP